MPIVGKFVADFTAFQAAVKQAEVSLTGMETNANKVGSSLNRMVDQFSGRKLVQDAQLMAQTFELLAEKGIGLTTSELQRMGAVGSAAIEKLKASGEKVPPEIQKIVDAANKVKPAMDSAQASTTNLLGTLQKAAATFGIAFSVGALTRFVGNVLDTASAIGDLSQQLGISAEAVQRFKYAAEQSGSSLDAVGTAIQFMNKTLSAGENSTIQALKDVGLGFRDIRSMNPEEAFVAISDAIAGIEDPMKQAEVVTRLFGRAAAELLPAIQDGIKKVGDQTSVMSDDTVRDLKRAQDAWSSLGTWVTTVSGTIIANTISTVKSVTESWESFAFFIANVVSTKSIGAALALSDITAKAREAKTAFDLAFDKKHAEQQREFGQRTRDAAEALEKQTEGAKKLKTAWDAYIQAALKRGDAEIKYEKQREEAIKKTNEQMDIFINKHLADLAAKGQNILRLTTDETVKLGLAWMNMGPVIEGIGNKFMTDLPLKAHTGIKPVVTLIKESKVGLDDLSKALSQMATVAGGTFGAMASGFATIVAGANTAKISIQQIKDASKTTDKFEGLLGMATGISGIISAALAAVSAIKGIWGAINQREGRHAVEDFADSFGGFDALHAKLLELGDAGEQLWIKLTQGTAAGNADAAARVIAEIEAALAKQADAVDEVTTATEEQAQATIETASQAAKALEELGPKIDTNKDEWKSWGDVVTAQIQRIADAVRALPMPGGGLPSAAAITNGSNGNGGSNITVVSMLDGRQIAKSTARYLPDALEGIA